MHASLNFELDDSGSGLPAVSSVRKTYEERYGQPLRPQMIMSRIRNIADRKPQGGIRALRVVVGQKHGREVGAPITYIQLVSDTALSPITMPPSQTQTYHDGCEVDRCYTRSRELRILVVYRGCEDGNVSALAPIVNHIYALYPQNVEDGLTPYDSPAR